MVSSLWVMADSIGGYLGDTLGSMAYDSFGFQWATFVMMMVMLVSVISSSIYSLCIPSKRCTEADPSDEEKQNLLSRN